MDRRLRTFVLIVLAVSTSATSLAGQKRAAAQSELVSLTSTDGVFQVKYPRSLVRCEHLNGEDPDVWSPENACAASIPVCDSSGHSGDVLACLAYPTVGFRGTELQAAAFSVSKLNGFETAKDCTERWANRETSDAHAEQIGGVKFQAAKSVETETGHVAERSIYRTFHNGVCYELDLNLTIALDSAFAVEDAPRKLTPAERERIEAGLKRALEGFRFLK